jgi:hypothetical protein
MNNFERLMSDWEDQLPKELEFTVMRHASSLSHFGDMVSLFVINTMSTVVHIVTGGEDPKCLRDKRERIAAGIEDRAWRHPLDPNDDPLPGSYGTRHWIIPQ